MSFGESQGDVTPGNEPSFTEYSQQNDPAPEAPQEQSEPQAQPEAPQSDGHPAWAPFKETLGDFAFHKVTPILKEYDAAANQRITEVNSKYEPWKQFAEAGIEPAHVSQAFEALQRIQSDPVAFYNNLAQSLREQGLLEEAAEAQSQANQAQEDEDNWETPDPRDEQIRMLTEQNQQILAFQEAQVRQFEQEQMNAQARDSLATELTTLQAANPGMAPQELKATLERAHLYLRAGEDKPLADVLSEIRAERSSVLQQPRPNDRAPRLPGAGGSAPTGAPPKAVSEYSREESQALFAERLRQANQAG